MLGLEFFCFVLGRGLRLCVFGESFRNVRSRILEMRVVIFGFLVNFFFGCGDCLDYYRVVFDYNLVFNYDDIFIC